MSEVFDFAPEHFKFSVQTTRERGIMPFISITYREDAIDSMMSEVVKTVIRYELMKHLSTKSIKLTWTDFSFVFLQAGAWDELTHDIVVNIPLHAFPDRLIVPPDANADRIAKKLGEELMSQRVRPYTIGVQLIFAEIGWGAGGWILE